MYQQTTIQGAPSLSESLLSLLRKLAGLPGMLYSMLLRAQQRRQLLMLSDHMLKDIGISRADAECEASKPFWRK